MRFEDWDVLLFPSGTHDQHVPLREYRIECHSVEDERLSINGRSTKGRTVAPLMTAFIPSLEHNAPFQLSVHSWMPKSFYFAPKPGAHQPDHIQVWQIKVIVDGATLCVETFRDDVRWPKVVSAANKAPHLTKQGTFPPLQFPKFHEEVMAAADWSPHDTVGRIKIEIAEGYARVEPGDDEITFHKLLNHAVFNFQPAPLRILQRTGIAYPNPEMAAQILPLNRPVTNFLAFPGAVQAPSTDHTRNMSVSSVGSHQYTSPYMGPGGPPNTPHFEEVPPPPTA